MTPRGTVLGAALAAILFAAYAAGVAPGVEWLDAGELTAAAFTLGVSHPPGQPGHALLGRIAAYVPVGEVAFRVNLLSAIAAIVALAGAVALARRLLPDDDALSLPVELAALAGAALIGLSPLVGEQALRAEVYAPALALVTWGATFALAWMQEQKLGRLFVAGLLFGLAAAVHPIMAVATAGPFALAALMRAGRRIASAAGWGLAGGALGLATLAYLPLRAAAPARALLVWGEPDSLGRFLAVVRARAYAGNFAWDGYGERIVGHAALLVEGTGLAVVGVGLVGLAFGAMTRLRGCGTLLLAAALVVAAAAAQKVFLADNPDVHGYLIPALPLLAPGLAVMAAALARLGDRSRVGRFAPLAVLAPLAILAFVGAEPVHARGASGRRHDDPLRFWDETLARMGPGPALYVADSDDAIFPALYERIVGGARPDVAVVSRGLVTSSWFLRMVDRAVPELFVPFVDDGGRKDALAERLIVENARAGRPVGGEDPSLPGGETAPLGRGYVLQATPPSLGEPPPPLSFEGDMGKRVARRTALLRAEWELAHGRPLEAARAAGVLGRLDEATRAALAQPVRPPLAPLLPRPTAVFVSEPWQEDLLVDDLVQMAGQPPGPAPVAPFERRLLHAWALLLHGDATGPLPVPDVLRASPGADARLATARMFERLGRTADALAQLQAILARQPGHEGALVLGGMLLANEGKLAEAETRLREAVAAHPTSARAWATLGVVLAKKGDLPAARDAWERSLSLDPQQPDVRSWLNAQPR